MACIEQATKVTDGAFAALKAALRPGMTEKEAAAIIENHFKANRMGLSFPTISVFGKGTVDIHGVPSDRRLEQNDIIMVDIGARYEGEGGPWCSDVTRTFFVGEPTARQREIWNLVHEAQKLGLAKVRPGATAGDVDKASRDFLRGKGFSIPHAVGHGVGRKVHEAPTISQGNPAKLKVGDVITVEPGVYLSREGFGVRVEDILVVTEDGYRMLSRAPY
ncbi:MAG TPA: M24 family metallopeptidase [Myxococcota bacterium]|nr:M24 family metallopeptidase [Myxococcota bacterium]